MAFTGAPVTQQVADDLVRITGAELEADTSGTIGLFPSELAPDIRLPQGFRPNTYADTSMQASVKVDVERESGDSPEVMVTVVKTGSDPSDFQITLTNVSSGGGGGVPVVGNSELNGTFPEG